MIKRWKPWERSTGPRTAEGKAKAASNAYKGGKRQQFREQMKELRAILKEHNELLEVLSDSPAKLTIRTEQSIFPQSSG